LLAPDIVRYGTFTKQAELVIFMYQLKRADTIEPKEPSCLIPDFDEKDGKVINFNGLWQVKSDF
jgi:hypothetical protein